MLISYISFIIIIIITFIIFRSEGFQNHEHILLHKSKHNQQLGHTFYKESDNSDDEENYGFSLKNKIKKYTIES
jgi:hypothetical protein